MNERPMSESQQDSKSLENKVQVNRTAIRRLKDRVEQLEKTLDIVCGDLKTQWLFRNRSERMDPSVPIFEPGRAEFHNARYEFAKPFAKGKHVADIASGTGYGCEILLNGGAKSIVGIDNCIEAVQYAEEKHNRSGIEYRCRSAVDTGLESASLDVIVSFETIEHLDDEQGLLTEFSRLLRPGGTLICSTPNQWPLAVAPHHVREYDRESFVEALEHEFDIVELYNQNSGTDSPFNRGQTAGIVETNDDNYEMAECFIAVAKVKK